MGQLAQERGRWRCISKHRRLFGKDRSYADGIYKNRGGMSCPQQGIGLSKKIRRYPVLLLVKQPFPVRLKQNRHLKHLMSAISIGWVEYFGLIRKGWTVVNEKIA